MRAPQPERAAARGLPAGETADAEDTLKAIPISGKAHGV
jgi:hypothetical protein